MPRKPKVKRRPPNTIHLRDMIQAIERRVWFHLKDVTVSHIVNEYDQPEIVVSRIAPSRRTVRLSLACFCFDPKSPWIDQGTKVEDIALSVCASVSERFEAS